MTHADLVKRASGWLRNKMNCRFVICEQMCSELEIADAIGFKNGHHSYLVECKVSRSDFLADRKKPFRIHPHRGMGMHRYYMAPEGIITIADLPPKWGLLEVTRRGVRLVQKSESQTSNKIAELSLLTQVCAMSQANVAPKPLHEWLTCPESAYGKLRQAAKEDRISLKEAKERAKDLYKSRIEQITLSRAQENPVAADQTI